MDYMGALTDSDTIAAISTAIGPGGINIVRLSGSSAIAVADTIFRSSSNERLEQARTHKILYGRVVDPQSGLEVDEALVSIMRAPRTYTREDTVEINCHGGARAAMEVLEIALSCGARIAEPGEFTKRAFLHGRIDLAQAEAVADIIRSRTSAGLRSAYQQLSGSLSKKIRKLREQLLELQANLEAAVDWPEEEIIAMDEEAKIKVLREAQESIAGLLKEAKRSQVLQEGVTAAIIGRPNVGKSSLLNYIVGHERAIVTAHPGTTRDVVEASVNVRGIPVVLKDTAGIHDSEDEIEKIGIARSREALERSAINVFVIDSTEDLKDEDGQIAAELDFDRTIVVLNKTDIAGHDSPKGLTGIIPQHVPVIRFSSLTGEGIEELENILEKQVYASTMEEHAGGAVSSIRHIESLRKAAETLAETEQSIVSSQPEEISSMLVGEAYKALGEIIGESVTNDLLDKIFASFCIGK